MSVSSKAEGEASRKGLAGAAKRQYVGGAINRAKHEKAEAATPAARQRKQQHSYQREAVADARAQIRYHEAQIAGLREGVKLRRELAGPKRAATPKTPAPKRPRTIDEQIAAAGGYVPKTPADKLRKTPVRELTDAQLLRDWENRPPERRRGVLEREMARRQAKAAKAQQPAPRRVQAGARPGGKRAKVGRSDGILSPREAAEIRLTPRPGVEDVDFDPSAPLNPYQLHELYGDAQMRPALSRYTAPRLREAVRAVQARNPGTRPAGADRGAMIHYIEQHVSGAAKPAAPAPRRVQAGAKPRGKPAKKPATTPPRAAPITRPLPKEPETMYDRMAAEREAARNRKSSPAERARREERKQGRAETTAAANRAAATNAERARRNAALRAKGYRWHHWYSGEVDNRGMDHNEGWGLLDPNGTPVDEDAALRRIGYH